MSYKKSPFEQKPKKSVNRSRFNRSHEYKAMIQLGYLVPVLTQETLPNEYWTMEAEFLFRFQPMYFPIMHRVTMRYDIYFCPNRILWPGVPGDPLNPGWKKWITEEPTIALPKFNANMAFSTTTFNNNILGYMGIPMINGTLPDYQPQIDNLLAFPLSAILAIWDEYERIPQLEDEKWFPLTPGNTNTTGFQAAFNPDGVSTYFPCLSAKWAKDYLTSCLPSPQYGESTLIPLVADWEDLEPGTTLSGIWLDESTGLPAADGDLVSNDGQTEVGGNQVYYNPRQTAATMAALRLAEAAQSFYERVMKWGTRYRDWMKGMFGDDPEPGVVDVPVLLGSIFGKVQVADVMSQSYTFGAETSASPGDYTGQANMYKNGEQIKYKCMEHGWIIGILQVNPNTSYGQGIDRKWRRTIQQDYALDMFAHIGDQEVYKEEVAYNAWVGNEALNQGTFGYIERFAEYKYQNDIHVMNMNFTNGKSMHLGRIWDIPGLYEEGSSYDSNIEINEHFVSTQPNNIQFPDPGLPTYGGGIRTTDVWRLIISTGFEQYPTDGTIFAHIRHSIEVDRQLPMFSTPDLT